MYHGIFRNLAYSVPEAYSEPCQRQQLTTAIINANYSYCHDISFSRSLCHKKNIGIFFNASVILTPEVLILYKKV